MSLLSLLSLKSIVSIGVLLIALGIGSFLYLTVDTDFEAQPGTSSRMLHGQPLKTDLKMDDITQIINTARQAWSIIDNNRAIADVQTSYGNGLPNGITDPFQLQTWASPPASQPFTVNIYNRLGQRVLQFTYTLQYNYGGSLDGKGAYLDRVTILPSRLAVAWGFVFNAHVGVTSVHNVGTRDNPIAAMQVELHYRLQGLNMIERTVSFHVKADGSYTNLSA